VGKHRTRDEYNAQLATLARKALERHEIKEEGPGRWVLYRRNADGTYSAQYCAEIAALHWGTLLVHGDIETVVFTGGSHRAPLDLVRWVGGRGEPTDYCYLAQKAQRGMGAGTDALDTEVARGDVLAEIACVRDAGATGEQLEPYDDALRALDDGEHIEVVRHNLWRDGDDVDTEFLARLGRVIDPRVFYAHAACARLVALLDARAAAAQREVGGGI
jgi:hypothetical protein